MLALGAVSTEGSNERLGRQLLLLGGALMSCGGLLWGVLALAFGLPGPSVVPFGYVVITVINFWVLAQTSNFSRARVIQVLLSLMLPFLFQLALGGVVASGFMMLWAMIALVGSLTFSSAKESALWLAVYCALAVISGLIDEQAAARAPFVPTYGAIRLFFTLNVVVISSIVFGLAIVLNERQRTAIAALETGERTNRELADRLLVAVTAREADIVRLREVEGQLQDLTATLERQVASRTRELEAALVRAEEGTRSKSEFLATMSHEIRTPLNGILGTTELLRLSSLDEPQRECVGLIQRSGDLLLTIINDVLDFSKIEAGKLELVPRPFDLMNELETVVGLHRARAVEKGVALTLEAKGLIPRLVVADADRLLQVVGNLLSNAVKFTASGSIVLAVTSTPKPNGRCGLELEVKDTGIGISSDALERLFRPFTQADSSTTRRFGGTGLGLAICARLLECMGGSISVTSVIGQGTTFRVQLDVSRPSPEEAKPAELPEGPTAHEFDGLRVLLAEDNLVNQTIGAKLLRHFGCEVAVASNGAEAVERASAATFDLVLMDVQMPVLDGLEAAKRILELDSPTTPRIVALTANAFESDRRACLDAGMHDFLTKPLRVNELKNQLRLTVASARDAA